MKPDDVLKTRGVPVRYRKPFALHEPCWCDERQHGETILEIVRSVPDLPLMFAERGVVCINGEVVPRALWAYVRPKPCVGDLPVTVTLHLPLAGGGGGGGAKTIVSLVAALALVVLTAGIGSGFAVPLLGSAFGAGTFGASALAAAVGIAGALAISALSAPPTLSNSGGGALGNDTNTDQKEAAGASDNILDPGGAIPRVLGSRKVFPPYCTFPVVGLVDDDEFVEVVFALNGPHEISDIRIDGVPIAEADDVEFETREGWFDDEPLTLVARQGRMIFPQITLSVHKVNPDSQTNLADPSEPADDLPVWHGVSTRSNPDEVALHFLLPNGISINGSPSTNIAIPLRLRIRKRGDLSWINLPEVHVADSTLSQIRRAIVLKFTTPPDYGSIIPPPSTARGFYYANINVPGQVVDPATTGWDADNYFVGTGGTDYLTSASVGGSNVKNTGLYDNRAEFYLDPANFDPGIYEIEIIRGSAYQVTSFTPTSYQYSGSVKDFFTYSGTTTPVIPMTRANLADVMSLVRVVSIWNEYPILKPGFALIAVKARNRSVQKVSALASGFVRDWDGSDWTDWTTTSNPAPHYRDILSGDLNLRPLPDDLRGDDDLVAWRTLCTDNDWTIDAIISDMRTQDALDLCASCGYGKTYQSDTYAVMVDSDRSLDAPVQVFSRLNAANVRYERAFAQVPDGFVVTYRDEATDDDQAQTIVYQRDRSLATTGLLESITYEGIIEVPKVEARALFDLDQANSRATFYYLDTDVECLMCRRGDLIGLQHDVLSVQAGDARVLTKTILAGNITGLVLNSDIPIKNEPDMHAVTDMHAVDDMHDVGWVTGIALRRNDGTISTHALSNTTGETDTITFATPIADTAAIEGFEDSDGQYGCLLVSGKLNYEYLRLLVASMSAPDKNFKTTLTLVDEAPDLVRYSP